MLAIGQQITRGKAMRGLLGLSCAAILAAAIVVAPKPASALPAASTIAPGHAHAGVVEEVGRRWYRGPRRYYRPYRYQRYGYRPYYGRPYYRGWGYPYWRRPGVNIWLGW
jgi:hypothetical protein